MLTKRRLREGIHNSMDYGKKRRKKEHCLHRLEYLIFSPKFAKIRMIQKLIIKIRNPDQPFQLPNGTCHDAF